MHIEQKIGHFNKNSESYDIVKLKILKKFLRNIEKHLICNYMLNKFS